MPAWISPSGNARASGSGIPLLEFSAAFKHVMRAPHGPHAGSEVWIEVAMEDRVADDLVAIAAAVIGHLERVTRARADHLAVEISALIAVRRLQPLMCMLVMDVADAGATVKNSELEMIVDVAVIDV